MKLIQYPDREHLRESKEVTLADGVSVTVYSLPITVEIEFKKAIPPPDEKDTIAVEDWNLLHAAAMIEACIDKEQVSFYAPRVEGEAETYYRAILGELNDFLTPKQVMDLGRAITDLTNPTEAEVADAEKDFTDPES